MTGPEGGGRSRHAVPAIAAALAPIVVACASGTPAGPATGADGERSGSATMATVTLTDVAGEVGLDFRHGAYRWGTGGDPAAMMGGGICWIDVDRDGWLDLFVTNTWSEGEWGEWRREGALPTTRLFRNERGRFQDATADVAAGLEIRANGCVAADLDLDGWTDLYVTSDRSNVLLWNDEGTFAEGAETAGVAASGWQSGAAVGDIDGDGRPDLFVAGYADTNRRIAGATKGFPNTFEPEPDLLYLGKPDARNGRARFTEVAAEAGIEMGGLDYGLGAVFTDTDDDGDLDLYVANDTNPNRLYLNVADGEGEVAFVDEGASTGTDDDNAGMGVAAGDYDGDRGVDLVVTNLGDQGHVIFRRDLAVGDLAYVDALAEMGRPALLQGRTGWGTTWADLDLDADLDLVVAHGAIPVQDLDSDRDRLMLLEYRSDEAAFVDASSAVGLDRQGPYLGRGLAAADYDNDGDLDLAVGTIGGRLGLLRNSGAGGHWLGVVVEPPTAGAVVTVTLPDGTQQARELRAGSSYLSSEDPRVLFGLGSFAEVAELRVEWPDATSVARHDVAVDAYVAVASD